MDIPDETRTAARLLDAAAERSPDRVALRYLPDGMPAEEWTYADLARHVRQWAGVLATSTTAGARALLLLPSNVDHAVAFLACLYAGVVPVPTYLPQSGRLRRVRDRLIAIVGDAEPELALSTRKVLSMAGDERLFDGMETIAMDEPPVGGSEVGPTRRAPEDITFLQYSSGSTQEPKAVCNTQRSLLHQVKYMEHLQRVAYGEESMHIVSWLPLYHDMGLIFGLLGPLLTGGTATFMRPGSFAADPRRWFDAISRYRGNGTCGPDFSYQLVCNAFTQDEIDELDLSCVRYMGNGAEPVRPETMARVRDRFAVAGLPPTSISAAYGLAEAGLVVSTAAEPRPHRVGHYDSTALAAGRAEPVAPGSGRAFVGCGDFFHRWRVAIVDPETGREVPEDRTGEIWVRGPGLPSGYWNRPAETAEIFRAWLPGGDGPCLRTGDVGFLDHGELYVCGRLRDLIIVRGANYHPNDLERSVERGVDAVGVGGACAVQVDGRLMVFGEIDRGPASGELAAIAERVHAAVAGEHDITADGVVLIRRGSLLRTSSGKVRRQAMGRAYCSGDLAILHVDECRLPTIERLREAVAGSLGVAPAHVGDDTNLIQAGLDSLMAFRLAAQLGYSGTEVEFSELFDRPTLRAWASLAAARSPVTQEMPAVGTSPASPAAPIQSDVPNQTDAFEDGAI